MDGKGQNQHFTSQKEMLEDKMMMDFFFNDEGKEKK